jgi:hypothetical protein
MAPSHDDPQTVSTRTGMEQRQASNTAVGIPLLESSLRNAGVDLRRARRRRLSG